MPDRPTHPRFPPHQDISALVDRLSAAEAALEHSLGPGADAVLDSHGHAHLLRQAQVALQQSENRFRTLIEHSMDVIVLLAADGTVLYNISAITRVLGYTPTELVGQNVFEFIRPEDQAGLKKVFVELCTTPRMSVTANLRHRHKNGTYRWLEGTGTNLLDQPGINAVVLNYRDVTERKHAEAALRQQTEELRISNAELTRFNRAAVGRELRMVELKQEMNELCRRLGEPPRHQVTSPLGGMASSADPAPVPLGGDP